VPLLPVTDPKSARPANEFEAHLGSAPKVHLVCLEKWGPLGMEGAGARVGLGGAVSLLAMSAEREFDVVIVAEPEGGYSVFVPELPSVATQGETIEEARTNAQEAIEGYLEVMHEDGLPVPTVHRDRVAVHAA
jgi:predicted RNase H-like HicB family nuclease